MDLGDVLRRAREEAGLSSAEAAERAGVTRQALWRWETGGRPVRSDQADRVLAAYGRDVRFRLVDRFDDLDAELRRRQSLPIDARLQSIRTVLLTQPLHDLQRTGGVVFGGAWAAAAYGLPPLHHDGEVALTTDAAGQAAVAAVLRQYEPWLLEDGEHWGVVCNDRLFQRIPSARWRVRLLGDFGLHVTADAGAEQRLTTEAGPWRVVTPERLLPDTVDPTTLERWQRLT